MNDALSQSTPWWEPLFPIDYVYNVAGKVGPNQQSNIDSDLYNNMVTAGATDAEARTAVDQLNTQAASGAFDTSYSDGFQAAFGIKPSDLVPSKFTLFSGAIAIVIVLALIAFILFELK